MKDSFACTECNHIIQFGWSQVGRRISCEGCGHSLTVPAPMETIGEPEALPPPRLKFRCPSCQRKFSTKLEMAKPEDTLQRLWCWRESSVGWRRVRDIRLTARAGIVRS